VIRLLLVDDQELVRAGLSTVLRESFGFQVVGECSDGSGAAGAAVALSPDVVLMDVRMPVVDGIEATRRLRELPDPPPVLALTTFDDEEVLAGVLRAGASGFVLKGVPAEQLQTAVRVLAGGGSWLDPAVTGRVLTAYRTNAPPQFPRPAALTEREAQVIALIGAGRTNAEIAGELFIGEGTVKTHVHNIFSKLGLRDRAAAVVAAFDHGFVAPASAHPLRPSN